ncbi:hypothetical protein PFISCL1PPCAC_16405, partial [Pristionchus fissidentatus]
RYKMSDGEERSERKRKSKKSKHKKEKKSRRERSVDSDREEKEQRQPVAETEIVAEEPAPALETTVDQSTVPPSTVTAPTVPAATSDPSTSKEKEKEDDDDMSIDPWIPFDCTICKLNAKCYFRELRCSDGFYPSPVFFMRDPFTAPPRVRGRKPVLNDYVVIGAQCEICQLPVCLAKSCTLYFGAHFCSSCVMRERRRFPEKLVEGVTKARSALSSYVDPAKKEEEKE